MPLVLVLGCLHGLILASLALVPGLLACGVAHATRTHDSGRLRVVHETSRCLAVLLPSLACGFAGAGIFNALLNVALVLVLPAYLDPLLPITEPILNDNVLGFTYVLLTVLSFFGCFAIGMKRLRSLRNPKTDADDEF